MSKVGNLAITVEQDEWAVFVDAAGNVVGAVSPNPKMGSRVRLIFSAPKDVRITRTKDNPWNTPGPRP